MASNKFFGEVGYGIPTETAPGVWTDEITEVQYFGDVVRNSRMQRESSEKVSFDLSVSNSISIVADAFANEHFFAMRYVRWAGQVWTVTEVDASNPPRLLLRLGEVYNGDQASVTPGPAGSAG